jgi:23S rRNA (uracil1939-C5)-methyltransferase
VLGGILAPGEAADIAVTVLDDGLDVVLAAGRAPDLEAREQLAAFAEQQDLARLSWRDLGPGTGSRGADGPAEPIAHRRTGTVRFGEVDVTVPPGAFLQAGREAEAALSALVLEAAGGAGRVADLFAGCGTFTFPLTRQAAVLAVDSDAEAVAAIDAAARRSGLAPRIEAVVRNLYGDPLTAAELRRFDAVVFDPPRTGARDQAAALAASAVPVVVAVSCNPATFARDARLLADSGYALERVTPVDQFVWSPHIELTAVLRRPPRR